MRATRLLAPLLALFLLGACIADTDESSTTGIEVHGIAAPPGLDLGETYEWYTLQGLNPCDPPPDPWHPFVTHGYCVIELVVQE